MTFEIVRDSSLSTESAAVTHKKTHKEMVTMYIKLLAHAVSMSGEDNPQNII